MTVKLGEAVVYLSGDNKALQGTLEASERSTSSWASRLAGGLGKAVGGALVGGAAAAGAALVGLGAAAFSAGMTVDEAMDTIRVSTGASGDELDALGADFQAVFSRVPGEAAPVAETLSELHRRLGLTGPALQDVTEPLVRMSDLLGGDAATNASLLARVMGDWGLANEDAAGTLDKMFAASQQTGVGVEGLMQKVVQFGSPLRLMGFDLDTSIALFAKWEKEGVNAELVMGSLRIAAGKFAREGVDLQEGLQATIAAIQGASSESEALAMGMEVFGARAGPDMVAAIREGRFEVDDLTAAIANSEGAILGAAAATEDWPEKLAKLKNQATVALAPVGMALMDVATAAMDALQPALNALVPVIQEYVVPAVQQLATWLSEKMPGAIAWTIQAVKDVAAWFSGTLVPALQAVWEFIDAKVIPVIAAIVEWLSVHLPPAIEAVATFWTETLVPALQAVWEFIDSKVIPVIAGLVEWLTRDMPDGLRETKASFDETIAAIVAWWDSLKATFAGAVAFLKGLIQPFLDLMKRWWAEHGESVRIIVDALWRPVQEAFAAATTFIKGVVDGALGWIKGLWGQHRDEVTGTATGMWEGIQGAFTDAVAVVQAIVQGFIDAGKALWRLFGDDLVAIAQNLWNLVKGEFEIAMDVLGNVLDLIADLLTGDWEAAKEEMISIAKGIWDGIKLAFETGWTNIAITLGAIVEGIKAVFNLDWGEIGRNIIEGIKGGIVNAATGLADAARGAAETALGAVKGFLGIGSPSRVFAGLGRNLMEGMALGIQRAAPLPALAAAEASQLVSRQVVNNYTFNVSGQYRYQSEQSITDEVRLLAMLARG